jgi:electron transfer flavoprotein beta subunit
MLSIIVTVKQVLDPEAPASTFKINPEANRVVPPAGVPPVLNPDDESALEAALRIKELHESRITAISMGAKLSKAVLRRCLAAGADQLVLLEDDAFQDLDGYSTAVILGRAIKKLGDYGLVLSGRMAADTIAGQVSLGIAEQLGVPSVTVAKKVEVIDGKVRVERLLSDGEETVEAPLPALVTVSHELGELRKVPLRDVLAAQEKDVTVWRFEDLGMEAFPTQRLEGLKLYAPSREAECEFVEGETPEEKAATLVRRLREERIL